MLPLISSIEASRLPAWKAFAGRACAYILSLLFLASGFWKLTDLHATADRMVESLVPSALSLLAAVAVAVFETFAAVLLLFPKHRRWGAWIAGGMLAVFMLYVGVQYNRLLGQDCNCFPWIRRVVGPAFFAGDAAMLVLAGFAGVWADQSAGWRRTALLFCCVCLLSGGCYAITSALRSASDVPETAIVDGKPLNLRQGKVLLYFFDPDCLHCFAIAQEMGKQDWGATRIVALATREQHRASTFVKDSGLPASISPDAELLRKTFPFTNAPHTVALDQGKAAATFRFGDMDGAEYFLALRSLGMMKAANAR